VKVLELNTRRIRPAVLALAIGLVGCEQVTEVRLEITTDALCVDIESTVITTGTLETLDERPPTTSTSTCQAGRIGSLTVVPSGANNAAFAVKVVTGLGITPEECEHNGFVGGCIVARRALNFVPERSIELPILLEAVCIDVPCEATETCRNGRCVSAILDDPLACTDPLGCPPATDDAGGFDDSGVAGSIDAGSEARLAGKDGGNIEEGGFADSARRDASAMDGGLDLDGSNVSADVDASDAAGTDTDTSDATDKDTAASDAAGADTATTDAAPLQCSVGPGGYASIQAAIDEGVCPTITLEAGNYIENLLIDRDVELLGEGATTTIIDGGGNGRVIDLGVAVTVHLQGLTVTNGSAAEGAGIFSQAVLTLDEVVIENNNGTGEVLSGGGLLQRAGSVQLTNCALRDNQLAATGEVDLTARGGALFADQGAVVVLDGVVIASNQVSATMLSDSSTTLSIAAGGGIALDNGASLSSQGMGVTLSGNTADANTRSLISEQGARAGAIDCIDSELLLVSGLDKVELNEAVTSGELSSSGWTEGGAIHARGCSVTLAGTELRSNTARASATESMGGALAGGGALYLDSSMLSASEILCIDNVADARPDATATNVVVTAHGGCALLINGAAMTMTASTVRGNSASALGQDNTTVASGGGVNLFDGNGQTTALILRSTLGPDNAVVATAPGANSSVVANGGGLFAQSYGDRAAEPTEGIALDLVSSTISDNNVEASGGGSTSADGSGIFVVGSGNGAALFGLFNCTVSHNSQLGPDIGAGLSIERLLTSTTEVVLRNSILANSAGADPVDCASEGTTVEYQGWSIVQTSSCTWVQSTSPGTHGLWISTDPDLGPLQDNGGPTQTRALGPSSMAPDAGETCTDRDGALLDVDQRGVAREGDCDIGAFERTAADL